MALRNNGTIEARLESLKIMFPRKKFKIVEENSKKKIKVMLDW